MRRRNFLAGAGATALGGAAVDINAMRLMISANAAQQTNVPEVPSSKNSWFELGLMDDPILEQVLLFYLGHTWQGLADVSECLETASRVKLGDKWSWTNEWRSTANRLAQLAKESEATGHSVSAGEADLRASNYYIAAMHRHPDPDDPNIIEMTTSSLECFRKGIQHLDLPATEVSIPYENTTLPGYFYRSPAADKNAPTLIIYQGRDAWAIQDKMFADAGNKRGYHVLLFDGPGQGPVLRLQGLPFRHDWEQVISPVIDYTLNMDGVDPGRIAVMGLSMGGVLAPRAAAFEHRPKVYIANPGVISWAEIMNEFIAEIAGPDALSLVDSDPEAFNLRISRLMLKIPMLDWAMRDSFWKHGVATPAALMLDVRKYDNSATLKNIQSKMLLIDGEADDWSQSAAMHKLLPTSADIIRFTADDTGLLHCQTAASAILNHRLYNWLDDNL